MPVIIQIVDPRAGPYNGGYLEAFDHEAHDGRGDMKATPDRNRARRFADMTEALEFYRRSPACRPIRHDGLPNRPLTAVNLSFETVPLDVNPCDAAE